jgi:predicted alpha/beta-hydrolase family hydrolase
MPDHQERPAVALAHGAAQSADIERVRRDVDAAEACVARHDRTSAARRRRGRRRRAAARKPDTQP